MKRLLSIVLAFMAVTACIDSEPFLYRIITFGFPREGGILLSDDGMKYILSSIPEDVDWTGIPRVIAVIDVTESVSDSTFKARLQQFSAPLFKEPVVLTDPEVPDTLGTDDIMVSDVWYSGGCLNMINVIKIPDGSKGSHVINLLADCREETADTLRLEIRHRNDSELSLEETLYDYSFYSSFPITALMPERDSVVIKVSWIWDGETASAKGKVKI